MIDIALVGLGILTWGLLFGDKEVVKIGSLMAITSLLCAVINILSQVLLPGLYR
jgi:hypothetical protein